MSAIWVVSRQSYHFQNVSAFCKPIPNSGLSANGPVPVFAQLLQLEVEAVV